MQVRPQALTKASTLKKIHNHFNAELIYDNVQHAIETHARDLLLDLKDYPDRPLINPATGKKYRYKRTGNLSRGWHAKPTNVDSRGTVFIEIDNDARDPIDDYYASLVQGNFNEQRKEHQIVWANHRAHDIQRRLAPRLNGKIHTAIRLGTKGQRMGA